LSPLENSTVIGLSIVALLLSIYLLRNTAALATERAGRWLFFAGAFIVPLAAAFYGSSAALHTSTQTNFCLSCHEMKPYGQSLMVDDDEVLPSIHYQNHLVPSDQACYTCHRDYAMFGTAKTKLNGLRHLYAHYISGVPDTIKLFEPFSNANCLHCHDGARNFMEKKQHNNDSALERIRSGQMSCLTSGCHDVGHSVHHLEDFDMWEPASK
jgi:cytochrome c-type protein NapC